MQRVLASAIVDVVKEAQNGHLGNFKVEVWGKEPHDYVRHYQINAKSDTLAAQEGINRFVEEMEKLDIEKD
jgi:hypothetical protein